MATTKFHGDVVQLAGEKLVAVGDKLNGGLTFTTLELADKSLKDLVTDEKALVLSFFPSVDTGVCATSVREFNEKCGGLDGVKVLCISADLPFAFSRFCAAEGIEKVVSLSTFRHPEVFETLGIKQAEGPLAGLCARLLLVVNKDLEVTYAELTDEVSSHLDYEKALAAVKALL